MAGHETDDGRWVRPRRTHRVDRTRGLAIGSVGHPHSPCQVPPDHLERIEAHSRRVLAELDRLGSPSRGERGSPAALRRRQHERRARVVVLLAAHPEGVERPSIATLLGLSKGSLDYLLNHPWFRTRRRVMRTLPRGGGQLPSIVTLTPEGRAAAEALAREGGVS